jgi:hypothetical protein
MKGYPPILLVESWRCDILERAVYVNEATSILATPSIDKHALAG